MQDLGEWLEGLGLGQYAEAFRAGAIEADLLPELDHAVLREMGVELPGHRLRILKAIRELAADREPGGTPPSPSSAATQGSESAEHRQLTVMFCDLVGSVALGERLGVEEYRDLLAQVRAAVVRGIERYDGFVARHQGDGLLAYFGYPQAHENDAERAVRAGLDVIDVVARLDSPGASPLAVRIGIATGPAVVGDVLDTGESHELAALGSTPNLAARLQGLADPGSLLVSRTTMRLTEGLFETVREDGLVLKGFEAPVTAHRVTGTSEIQTRSQATERSSLTPLVGRTGEIELVLGRWEQARSGSAQSVLICAEPGVGKSRVVREVRARCRAGAHRVIALYCSPHHTDVALYPVTHSLRHALGPTFGPGSPSSIAALEAWLKTLELPCDECVPFLAPLLSLAPREHIEPSGLSPDERRRRTLDVLVGVLEAASAREPLLLVAEDLHWCDPTTLELLGLTIERLHNATLLALLTSRPEFRSPWSGLSNLTTLSLNHLTAEECRVLVQGITRDHPLPEEVLDQIVSRTDGVPLFVEELSAAMLESLTDARPGERIPATLRDALTARLDRLGDAKHVAQIASVIGREFSFELLASADGGPDGLPEALENLEKSGLVGRRGEIPGAMFRFKHALVRESAYESLLSSRRREVHARVASALEASESAVHDQPELLAHHHAAAGNTDEAIAYRHRAGARASRSNALVEAQANYRAGLALLDTLEETPERLTVRAELLLGLGSAQMVLHGFASAEVRETYSVAREVTSRQDESARRFEATWGLWLNRHIGGDLEFARRLLDEVDTHAIGSGLVEQRLQAHHAAWTTLLTIGEVASAFEHTERGAAIYSEHEHREHAYRYGGHDPGVCAGAHAGIAGWLLGEPDRALARWETTIDLARRLDHPPSAGTAAGFGAYMFQLRGEPDRVLELTDGDFTVPAHMRAGMDVIRGWALAALGSPDRGVRECERALNDYAKLGAKIRLGYLYYLMAESLRLAGRVRDALVWIGRALTVENAPGSSWLQPELIRIQAVLRVEDGQGDTRTLLSGARAAYEAARRAGVRGFEVRAAVTLGEALRDRGDLDEARALLAPLIAELGEGSSSTDARGARRLLDSLG